MHIALQLVLGIAFLLAFEAYKFGPSRAPTSVVRKVFNIRHTAHSFIASSAGQPWLTPDADVPPSRRLTAYQNRLAGPSDESFFSGPYLHCRANGVFSPAELEELRKRNGPSLWRDLDFGHIAEWQERDAAASDGYPDGSLWIDARKADDDENDEDVAQLPIIVFLPSGNGVSGSPAADRGPALALSRLSGWPVLSAALPLAPETPSAQIAVSLNAILKQAASSGRPVVLVDASGGSTFLDACQITLPPIRAAVVLSPLLSSPSADEIESESYSAGGPDAAVRRCLVAARGGGSAVEAWQSSRKPPPLLIHASESEPAVNDARLAAKHLPGAKLQVIPHLPYLGPLRSTWYPEATQSLTDIVAWIKTKL